MSMRAGLRTLLKDESTIEVEDRVYVTRAPQKADITKDHIIITQLSSEENKSLDTSTLRFIDKSQDSTSTLRFLDFDIDCKSITSARADDLAVSVRLFLDDYTGAAGNETIGAVLFNDESDSFEVPADGSDIGLYVSTLDFQIQYVPA